MPGEEGALASFASGSQVRDGLPAVPVIERVFDRSPAVAMPVRAAANLEGAPPVPVERVRPRPADQQVASEPAAENVVAGATDEDVVGDAPTGVEGVAAVAAEQHRRHGDVDLLAVDLVAFFLDRV